METMAASVPAKLRLKVLSEILTSLASISALTRELAVTVVPRVLVERLVNTGN